MSVAIGAPSMAVNGAQDSRLTITDSRLTITGCLEGPINTGDEYARSLKPARFRLAKVTMKPMPAGGSVFLIGGDEKQLMDQVGRQVLIVGTMVDPALGDEDTVGTVTGTTGSTPTVTGEPTVRVQSVRRVAEKCSTRK